MHRQTVDQIMSTMSIIQQPAFCLRSNGTIVSNELARNLAPSCSAVLPDWLGDAKRGYLNWDRSGKLQLSVHLSGLSYMLLLQPLQDGTLFLMTPQKDGTLDTHSLAVTSQVLRGPLSELNSLLQRYAREENYEAAPLNRQMHRLSRIVSNLTEIDRLSAAHPSVKYDRIDAVTFFTPILEEAAGLIRGIGREFTYTLPAPRTVFCADTGMLSRAILNLLSNAVKYSPDNTPISLRINSFGNHIVIQTENTCADSGSDLLQSAFNRLDHRSLLPNPSWGIGLGLPIVQAICRLHEGTLTLELQNNQATVTMTLSSKIDIGTILEQSIIIDYNGGMRQSLIELSDILPSSAYER